MSFSNSNYGIILKTLLSSVRYEQHIADSNNGSPHRINYGSDGSTNVIYLTASVVTASKVVCLGIARAWSASQQKVVT